MVCFCGSFIELLLYFVSGIPILILGNAIQIMFQLINSLMVMYGTTEFQVKLLVSFALHVDIWKSFHIKQQVMYYDKGIFNLDLHGYLGHSVQC